MTNRQILQRREEREAGYVEDNKILGAYFSGWGESKGMASSADAGSSNTQVADDNGTGGAMDERSESSYGDGKCSDV